MDGGIVAGAQISAKGLICLVPRVAKEFREIFGKLPLRGQLPRINIDFQRNNRKGATNVNLCGRS